MNKSPFMKASEADLLASLIGRIDSLCHKNFSEGSIVSERDYVSMLVNFIRYPLGPFSQYKCAYSQTLNGSHEQRYGADGIIVFRSGNQYKVGVFEAKVAKTRWDNVVRKSSPKTSRFKRQLEKQGLLNSKIAVWEMFFVQRHINDHFCSSGSTCIKRIEAIKCQPSTDKWEYEDLKKIAQISYNQNLNRPISLEDIVKCILSCNFGEVIECNKYDKNGIELHKEKLGLFIPLIPDFREIDFTKIQDISRFLVESNLFSYTYIDLDDMIDIEKLLKK